MNIYLKQQIRNMKIMLQTFQQSCQIATLADDGVTSKEEQKQLKKIEKACRNFEKELEEALK